MVSLVSHFLHYELQINSVKNIVEIMFKVFSSLLKNRRNLPPSPTSNLKLTCKLHTTLIHSLSKSPKDP